MMILDEKAILDDVVDVVLVDAAYRTELLLNEMVYMSLESFVLLKVHAPTLVSHREQLLARDMLNYQIKAGLVPGARFRKERQGSTALLCWQGLALALFSFGPRG